NTPVSLPIAAAPPQPVTESPFPVMVNPFKRSSTPGTPNWKHGVLFATSQRTSPTRSVLSTMTKVAVRTPLTRSAAKAGETRQTAASTPRAAAEIQRFMVPPRLGLAATIAEPPYYAPRIQSSRKDDCHG